jgi:hypothetical protein
VLQYSTSYGGEGNLHTAFAINEESMYYEQNQSPWSTGDSHVLYGEDASNKPSWVSILNSYFIQEESSVMVPR